jgi:serine/threonine protein kinase
MPDLSGCDVAGRYRLERLLRESPKSVVYAASDHHVPREVALKLLSPELARYPGYREWFDREARMAAALQHPHICPVLDSGAVQLRAPDGRQLDTLFLCLTLMSGGSLADRMMKNEPVAPATVREWIESLGSALGYAHDQKVVHGDLKPTALVFDGSGRLYLSDFASAQQGDGPGSVPTMGTPAFMAPEQWTGGAPTAFSDQYSMAVVAYWLITGARPFEGQDHPEIRARNVRTGAPAAHEEAARNGREGIPRAVSDVLKRALHTEPEKRFASVRVFTDALLSALSKGRIAGAQPFVFFSYDRELSGGWARFFADRLSVRHGVKVFMDTVGLDKAGRFPRQLQQAIEDCDLFVCFMAGEGVSSKWVAEEIRLAHHFGKTMIPIIQESFVEPEISDEQSPIRVLLSHQGIKLFDVSGYYVEHAVTDLARMILDALASPES